MVEQLYFVDPNTIERGKPRKLFGWEILKPVIKARAIAPHQDEEFVMLDTTFEHDEQIRKLLSLRAKPKGSIGLGLSGDDFILGPNIDEARTDQTGQISWGNGSQLRVWVRNTLKEKK